MARLIKKKKEKILELRTRGAGRIARKLET